MQARASVGPMRRASGAHPGASPVLKTCIPRGDGFVRLPIGSTARSLTRARVLCASMAAFEPAGTAPGEVPARDRRRAKSERTQIWTTLGCSTAPWLASIGRWPRRKPDRRARHVWENAGNAQLSQRQRHLPTSQFGQAGQALLGSRVHLAWPTQGVTRVRHGAPGTGRLHVGINLSCPITSRSPRRPLRLRAR